MLRWCIGLDLQEHPFLPVDHPVVAATSVLFVEFARWVNGFSTASVVSTSEVIF